MAAGAGGVLALGIGALWLFRIPIAETLVRSRCEKEALDCKLDISRLDFSGVTLRSLSVRDLVGGRAIVDGEQLALDLSWSAPWSMRPARVAGRKVVLTLDLTGEGPVLGPLQAALERLPKRKGEPTPVPDLSFPDVAIRAETPAGLINAGGALTLRDQDTFSVNLTAQPISRRDAGANLDLSAARLVAKGAKGEFDGRLDVDINELASKTATLEDLNLHLVFAQEQGELKGRGTGSVAKLDVATMTLNSAEGVASVVMAPLDFDIFSQDVLIRSVRSLALRGQAAEGAFGANAWSDAGVSANIDVKPDGGAEGPVKVTASGVKSALGSAKSLEVSGEVVLAPGQDGALAQSVIAKGQAVLDGATLDQSASKTFAETLQKNIGAFAPSFGSAAASAARRAGQDFRLVLPWSLAMSGDKLEASALGGAELRSDSGFFVDVKAGSSPAVFTWRQGASSGDWNAGGGIAIGGGGGPPLVVELTQAAGRGGAVSGQFSADLDPWRVGDERLEVSASKMDFALSKTSGRISGAVDLSLTGSFAGGRWTGARAGGRLHMTWSPEGAVGEAPDGFSLSWREARYGSTALGAGRVSYTPSGSFIHTAEGRIAGAGAFTAIDVPVKGDGFEGRLAIEPLRTDWTYEQGLNANFATRISRLTIQGEDGPVPIELRGLSGRLQVDRDWRATGKVSDGSFQMQPVRGEGVRARFDLRGRGGELLGALDDVRMRLVDPSEEASQVFEPLNFEGRANLEGGDTTFSGSFTLAGSGVSMGNVSGTHDLDTGAGQMSFSPNVLVFRPGVFEPPQISPRLRGPANVTGRLAMEGMAKWSKDDFNARAIVDVTKLGFTLASAGVFEGVSGRVEISDLLAMKSAPGQQLTIDRVTLGMPIEKGRIDFQLIGFDGVRLQSAQWPFVGGFIRIRPVDFMFSADANRVVAAAERWDLHSLVDQFKIPDLKMEGRLSGDFPVVFRTGSARIDHAVLKASDEGGVIQYTGAVGNAAGNTDPNARLLFDALKDFQFRVLSVELDGELTGRINMKANIQGSNAEAIKAGAGADILAGAPFDLNIAIDSSPFELFNNLNRGNVEVQELIGRSAGAPH